MKSRLLALTALAIAAVMLAACGTNSYSNPSSVPGTTATPAAAGATVQIANFAFSPATLTVKVGTTVTWTNQDSAPHTTTSDTGVWTSNQLSKGQSFSYTFKQAGTFAYHCSIHPNMKATIVVTP